jgi:hypothetical protein
MQFKSVRVTANAAHPAQEVVAGDHGEAETVGVFEEARDLPLRCAAGLVGGAGDGFPQDPRGLRDLPGIQIRETKDVHGVPAC